MIDWLIVYGIGWQWWAALALPTVIVATLLLVRVVGLSRAIQIGVGLGVALGAAILLRRSRQQGWADRQAKLDQDNAAAAASYRDKENEIGGLSDGALRERGARWVRDGPSDKP